MRTKIIAVLLAILTALGGLNLFKSIRDRLLPEANATESSEQIRIKLNATVRERAADALEITERIVAKIKVKVSKAAKVSSASEVMIDETFKVRDGQTLFLDVAHSDIEIETGAQGEARIRVTLSGTNMARARDVFDDMQFSVRMDGDELRVVSVDRRNAWNGNNGSVNIKVLAFIPQTFNLQMTTTHGDVELDDISGSVVVNTTHGDLSVSTIKGKEIYLRSTHGDIDAESFEGNSITLKTTHADIDVDMIAGGRISVSTTHSDIEIGELRGESELSTTHGDIHVELLSDESADLRTSHGDIIILAPKTLKALLDLEGASVRLDHDFDFDGRIDKDEIRGRINGGGATIRARTTHGSVTVRSN